MCVRVCVCRSAAISPSPPTRAEGFPYARKDSSLTSSNMPHARPQVWLANQGQYLAMLEEGLLFDRANYADRSLFLFFFSIQGSFTDLLGLFFFFFFGYRARLLTSQISFDTVLGLF